MGGARALRAALLALTLGQVAGRAQAPQPPPQPLKQRSKAGGNGMVIAAIGCGALTAGVCAWGGVRQAVRRDKRQSQREVAADLEPAADAEAEVGAEAAEAAEAAAREEVEEVKAAVGGALEGITARIAEAAEAAAEAEAEVGAEAAEAAEAPSAPASKAPASKAPASKAPASKVAPAAPEYNSVPETSGEGGDAEAKPAAAQGGFEFSLTPERLSAIAALNPQLEPVAG